MRKVFWIKIGIFPTVYCVVGCWVIGTCSSVVQSLQEIRILGRWLRTLLHGSWKPSCCLFDLHVECGSSAGWSCCLPSRRRSKMFRQTCCSHRVESQRVWSKHERPSLLSFQSDLQSPGILPAVAAVLENYSTNRRNVRKLGTIKFL